eukprot:gene44135-54850_t
MHSRVRQQLGVDAPHRIYFEQATLQTLAAALLQHAQSSADTEQQDLLAMDAMLAALEKQEKFLALLKEQGIDFAQLPIVPQQRGPRSRLSFAQARQWFLWNLDPASTAYHIAGAIELKGELDVEAARNSFDALVARHEALRTVFREDENGAAWQEVLDPREADFRVLDLEQAFSMDGDPALTRAAQAFAGQPFDLRGGPLLRVGMLRASPNRHILVLAMHHVISDGWSLNVVTHEFSALYKQHRQGNLIGLEALPIQYADFALWQRSWLDAGERERQLAYWQKELGG